MNTIARNWNVGSNRENYQSIGNVIYLGLGAKKEIASKRKTDSMYKSNGQRKAEAGDPIRKLEDIKAMKEYFLNKDLKQHLFFVIGITSGFRVSDIKKLTYRDFQCREIKLREKKTRKFNSFYLTDEAVDAFEMLIDDLSKRGKSYNLDDYIFCSKVSGKKDVPNKQMNNSSIYRFITKAANELNIEGHISTHSLRKTFAYHMLRTHKFDEEARYTLQAMLNHSDIKTTFAYSGLEKDKQDEMRITIDKHFFQM